MISGTHQQFASYSETTDGIQITVTPVFVPEQSNPSAGQFLFAYHVEIRNGGTDRVQLLSRHWIITDGNQEVQEVKGDGVVGKQPVLDPGQEFAYTSACPLTTPTGNMRGTYLMTDSSGRQFRVKIPLFFLRHLDSLQ
jgi:ApaG protein